VSRDVRVPGYVPDAEGIYGADELDLAVSPRGAAVVAWVWRSDRGKPSRIQSAFRPPGGPWKEPRDVTPASGAGSPRLGIDEHNTAVMVYGRQLFGHPQVLKSRLRVPGEGWTKPTVVAEEGYTHSVAVDRAGNAVVVFTPNFNRVQAVSRPADGGWGTAENLSPVGGTDPAPRSWPWRVAVAASTSCSDHRTGRGHRLPSCHPIPGYL
jgi:hypothetical protein